MRKLIALLSMFSLLCGVVLTGLFKSPHITEAEERPVGVKFSEEFDYFDSERWSKAGIWSNGSMFNATWYPEQVTFLDSKMSLQIDNEDQDAMTPPYKAGELRSNDFYHYGLYEVRMKPANTSGTVSSFFTYTGPWDWENDPWDEIDIEFLGKDTTKIQFNYFTNGVGGNEHYYELGFDAADSFNTYAFEWRPDAIRWFVNGKLVHTATENIPQTPQKIMMNLWPGTGVDEWTGKFNGADIPVVTQYDWVKYTPLDQMGCYQKENQEYKNCEEATGNDTSEKVLVTFNSEDGNVIDTVEMTRGNLVEKPDDPIKKNYVFNGWYADEALTIPFDFTKVVTSHTVLFAKWEREHFNHVPYMYGFKDDTFRPDESVTRAQVATMLVRNLGLVAQGEIITPSYKDTAQSFAFEHIELAKEAGLMQGFQNGTFRPDQSVTRAQLAAVASRLVTQMCEDEAADSPLCDDSKEAISFTDVATDHWAANAIAHASSIGIIKGLTNGNFRPEESITRAQAVVVLNRLFERGPLHGVTEPSFQDVATDHWAFKDIEEASIAHSYFLNEKDEEHLVK